MLTTQWKSGYFYKYLSSIYKFPLGGIIYLIISYIFIKNVIICTFGNPSVNKNNPVFLSEEKFSLKESSPFYNPSHKLVYPPIL